MDRAIVLLLLGLTEAALHRLAPPNEPIAFDIPENESALEIPLTDFTAEPLISEWSMSTWIYLSTGQGKILTTNVPNISLSWFDYNLELYAEGILVEATNGGFPIKWIFVQIGSTEGATYGLVTVRGGAQYLMLIRRNINVASTTLIRITDSSDPMRVMKT